MAYPSEQYGSTFKHTVSDESWKRIAEYVDESDHHGITPKELGAANWQEIISVLTATENHIPQQGFDALIEDYKMYCENVDA